MIILLFIYVVICMLLMIAILLQSGKGGGLSSLASGGGGGIADAIGATGAERTMNKLTTGIAVSFMLMAILLSVLGAYRSQNGQSEIFSGAPPAAASAAFPDAGDDAP
jgi:preprotein translocase subunit SecG